MRGARIVWGLGVLVGCAAADPASEQPAAGAASREVDARGSGGSVRGGALSLVLVAADGTRWELRDGQDFDAWLAAVTSAPPVAGRLRLGARADQEFKRLQRVMRDLGAVGKYDFEVRLGVD